MLYIGTSGYSYEDWIGTFYPENTDKKEKEKIEKVTFFFLSNYLTKAYSNIYIYIFYNISLYNIKYTLNLT